MTVPAGSGVTTDGHPVDAPPVELPARALLVSRSPQEAAALSGDFDEVRLATPVELPDVLAAEPAFDCVVLAGVPIEDDQLRRVVQQVLAQGSPRLTVVLALDDEPGRRLVTGDATALTGLAVLGYAEVSGVPCLTLTPGAADAVPDLASLRPTMRLLASVRGRAERDAERLAALAESRRLRERLSELERRHAATSEKLATVRAKVTLLRTQKRKVAQQLERLQGSPLGRVAVGVDRARRVGSRNLLRSGRSRRLAMLAGLAVAGLAVLALVALGLAALSGSGYVGWVATVVGELVVVGLGLTWWGHRRLGAQVRALTSAHRAGLGDQRTAANQQRKRQQLLERTLRAHAAQSTAMERDVELVSLSAVDAARAAEVLARAATTGDAGPGETLTTSVDRLGRSVFAREQEVAATDSAHQTQAIANLFSMLPVDAAVPLMGGWAASPDVVLVLVEELLARRPSLVVECGSGVSTLWLALAIKKYGLDTRIVSLDHHPTFAEGTRAVLRRHGVDHLVEVRDAPLGPTGIEGHDTHWYVLSALEDLHDIGLLFVDGPPELTGPLVRYPAVPLLRDRFADQVTVVLDDLIRHSEQEITTLWAGQLNDFELVKLRLHKGASVFRRG